MSRGEIEFSYFAPISTEFESIRLGSLGSAAVSVGRSGSGAMPARAERFRAGDGGMSARVWGDRQGPAELPPGLAGGLRNRGGVRAGPADNPPGPAGLRPAPAA